MNPLAVRMMMARARLNHHAAPPASGPSVVGSNVYPDYTDNNVHSIPVSTACKVGDVIVVARYVLGGDFTQADMAPVISDTSGATWNMNTWMNQGAADMTLCVFSSSPLTVAEASDTISLSEQHNAEGYYGVYVVRGCATGVIAADSQSNVESSYGSFASPLTTTVTTTAAAVVVAVGAAYLSAAASPPLTISGMTIDQQFTDQLGGDAPYGAFAHSVQGSAVTGYAIDVNGTTTLNGRRGYALVVAQ